MGDHSIAGPGAGMHPTLISIENRYVYSVGGSNPSCVNITRLDTLNLTQGWTHYSVGQKFYEVPRHSLDKEARDLFDQKRPFYVDREGDSNEAVVDGDSNEAVFDGDMYVDLNDKEDG